MQCTDSAVLLDWTLYVQEAGEGDRGGSGGSSQAMSRSKSLPLSAHVVLGRSLQSSCSGLAGFNSSTLLQVSCTYTLYSPHPVLLHSSTDSTPVGHCHACFRQLLLSHMGWLHSSSVVALRCVCLQIAFECHFGVISLLMLLHSFCCSCGFNFVCPSDHPVVC